MDCVNCAGGKKSEKVGKKYPPLFSDWVNFTRSIEKACRDKLTIQFYNVEIVSNILFIVFRIGSCI